MRCPGSPFLVVPSSARRLAAAALVAAGLTVPATAAADENDLVLGRLAELNAEGNDVVPHNQDFRSLTSELGVVLAPRFMAPADTLGYAGFQFSAETSVTTISEDQRYWCATEQASGCGPGAVRDGLIPTVGVFARKGIWLPLPSFEIGAGVVHVLESRMYAAQTYAKFALHEGYHDLPLPSIAARGAASRLMGSDQLDLTIASLDVSVSKSFGIDGTFRLDPYVGWNYLWIVPRSEVVDKQPQRASDPMRAQADKHFVFSTQDNITRQRIFGGAMLKYYVFTLTLEANVALAGKSVDDRAGTTMGCDEPGAPPNACDATDRAGRQQTFSAALALDF